MSKTQMQVAKETLQRTFKQIVKSMPFIQSYSITETHEGFHIVVKFQDPMSERLSGASIQTITLDEFAEIGLESWK